MKPFLEKLSEHQLPTAAAGAAATAGDGILHAAVALDPILSLLCHALSVTLGIIALSAVIRGRKPAPAVDIEK